MTDLPEHVPPRTEVVAARALVVLTVAYSLVAQSGFLARSDDFRGDLAYHRGVALTMTAGSWQGEGPVAGVISYFGGLFPLVLGWTAEILGASFDQVVSVVSWVAPAALPLALLGLGRALWPGRPLDAAVLALVGTLGSSLARDRSAEWVFSALPSGTNEWPLYPRDVAVVLLYAALALVVRAPGWGRVALAGLVCGLSVATHAQFGAYATGACAVLTLVTAAHRGHVAVPLAKAAALGAVATIVSAWWWLPRVLVTLDAGGARLRSHPRLPEVDGSAAGILNAFGLVGVLALLGLVVLLRRGGRAERTIAAWFLLLLPLIPLGGLLADLGFVTGRRVWLFAGVPMVVCAAAGAVACIRRVPLALGVPVLAVALAAPSTAEVLHARYAQRYWHPETTGPFAESLWSGVLDDLREETVERHGLRVIAPDNDAAFIWLHTGAQPYSLQLAGWNKLGYDVAPLTGTGYLDRVAGLENAFRQGVPGLCELARTDDADVLVLRHRDELLATHDLRPSARWRVDPEERTTASIRRQVAQGLTYRDLNADEVLELSRGAELDLGWTSTTTRLVEVDLYPRGNETTAALELVLPDGREVAPRRVGSSYLFDVASLPSGARLRAGADVWVTRVAGYEPFPRASLPDGEGPVVLDRADLCR